MFIMLQRDGSCIHNVNNTYYSGVTQLVEYYTVYQVHEFGLFCIVFYMFLKVIHFFVSTYQRVPQHQCKSACSRKLFHVFIDDTFKWMFHRREIYISMFSREARAHKF